MIKELVVISGKGGSGKTSITLALASLFENKVMVDCDVDASDMHLILEPHIIKKEDFYSGKKAFIDKSKCIQCGICKSTCNFNAISDDIQINDYFCEGCGACTTQCPAHAITLIQQKSGEWYESNTRLGEFIHARLGAGEENSGKLVSQIRMQARLSANKNNCNLIIVDGSPGIGCPVIASISGADIVLIVIEPTMSGLHDAKRVLELTRHFKVKAAACINKYDINTDITNKIKEFLKENNVELLAEIPYSKDFTKAMINKKTLIELDENSIVSNEIKNIKNELERMLND